MTVGELIQELQEMEMDDKVFCHRVGDEDESDVYPLECVEKVRKGVILS